MANIENKTAARVEMEQCIATCKECQEACLGALQYCVSPKNKKVVPALIAHLLDCAEICQTAANFMLRGSGSHGLTCAVCESVCRDCAEQCEAVAESDPQLQSCADACQRCAESCEQMAEFP